MERIFATHGIPETLKSDNGPPFQGPTFRSFSEEKGFKHQTITPLSPEANGHATGFMKNIDKVAKTAHSEGKDWRRELYSFLGNYRATPYPCTRKTPYELSMNRIVQTKLPSFTQVSPDPEVQQKDQDAKSRMKAFADTKRSTKPHDLHIGDSALVKQKRSNKASPPFESVPYTIRGIKGSMNTASRSTDLREVTRNSSHFKKLGNPPGKARAEFQYSCAPQQKPQAPVEFDGPEMHESSQPTSIQPEGELGNPEESSNNSSTASFTVTNGQDSPTPTRYSRTGRRIQRAVWSKDYVK